MIARKSVAIQNVPCTACVRLQTTLQSVCVINLSQGHHAAFRTVLTTAMKRVAMENVWNFHQAHRKKTSRLEYMVKR